MRQKLPYGFLLVAAVVVGVAASVQRTERPAPVSDVTTLLQDLRILSADSMEGREVGTAGGAKARAYIVERFRAAGVVPYGGSYERPFTFSTERRGSIQGANVVGRIDGQNAEPHLVVTAHYDHLGTRDGRVYNGADDNASGTAALFAIAERFRARRPAHTLILAALDGEEAGLQGAKAFVRDPPVAMDTIALNLNLDMIGREPDNRLYVVGTFRQPYLKPYVQRVATAAPVMLILGHDDPGQRGVEDWTRDSDHWAFMEAGIPALYFGVEDFAQHHETTDDYDTISQAFYARAVDTIILAIEEFDRHLAEVGRKR